MSNRPISRRTMLKGAGSVAIGLPLLEEMLVSSAVAGPQAAPPVRALNVFFGLGIPAPLQAEGFDGVLEPLRPLRDKLLILRNVDQVRCDKSGMNAHFDGASGAFTGTPPEGDARSGGASIDQAIRTSHHPQGVPAGMIPTLVGGTFFRRSRISRYVHSYNADGTVAAAMEETPRGLFDRIFGTISLPGGGAPDGENEIGRRRMKRSVLDSVVDQYRFYTGPRSPLGAASRARVADHLDRIREFEQRAYKLQRGDRRAPDLPPRSQLAHGGRADPGGEGIDMRLDDLVAEWRLLADIYTLAIRLDRARFGAVTFLAAGERLRMTGEYEYGGRLVHTFDDAARLNGSGSKGCSHEWWHRFNEKKKNEELRAHAHMKMREVAYFLQRLDDEESLEANGRTILENSLITISTESGDGRHNNVKRELSGVFHAISGANGRFKTGQILDVEAEGIDLYDTMLEAMGCSGRLEPDRDEAKSIDAIRA